MIKARCCMSAFDALIIDAVQAFVYLSHFLSMSHQAICYSSLIRCLPLAANMLRIRVIGRAYYYGWTEVYPHGVWEWGNTGCPAVAGLQGIGELLGEPLHRLQHHRV